MLILLSSGARRRYREDIVRALALPSGLTLQFRYDAPYVEPGLADRAKRGGLVGQRALVVFVSTEKKGAVPGYVSCRFVTIKDTQLIGSSVVVTFFAEEHVQQADGPKTFADNEGVKTKGPRWEAPTGSDLKLVGSFFFEAADISEQPSVDTVMAFEAAVKRLTTFAEFQGDANQEFYCVLGLKTVEIDSHGVETAGTVAVGRGGYRLSTGRTYELEAFSYTADQTLATAGKEFNLRIDSDAKSIDFPLGKVRPLDSRYDLKRFRFTTPASVDAVIGSIRVFVKAPGETAYDRSDILLPVYFAGEWKQGLLKAGFLTFGTAVAAAAAAWDKLSWANGALIVIAALVAGLGSVFVTKKQ